MLSAYEVCRLETIKLNRDVLRTLGIPLKDGDPPDAFVPVDAVVGIVNTARDRIRNVFLKLL